jgi:hypothetical protein
MTPRRKKKPAPKPTHKRRRHTSAWTAAGVAPLAIALAAGSPGVSTPSAHAGTVVSSAKLISATDAIPRIGLSSPAEDVGETWDKPAPNKSQYGTCGWFGSAGADEPTNQRKNRTDLPPSYHAVTFDAITGLDWPHDATTRRDKWNAAQLAVIQPYEGAAVTVTGFVAAFRPQANNSESTNCGEQGEDSTDWHIALVGRFGDKESLAVVVETTPRIKSAHPNWVPATLSPLVGKKDSVRVSGYLLLDPVHKNHLNKYRQTLWEVHPIHRIEVFQNGAWKDLDGG